MIKFKGILSLALAVAISLSMGACTKKVDTDSGEGAESSSNGPIFRILAGSELKDMAKPIQDFGNSQGVSVQMTFTGSLDAVDDLSTGHNYDAVWVSHGKYLRMVPGIKEQVKASEKTMYSRVVLGVKPEKVKALKWKSGQVSWKDILAAVKAGQFHFAMTNPAGSNSGFVTLAGIASELSGKGDALEEGDIPAQQLKDFFAGRTLASGSSGTLATKFKENSAQADAIINYESVIQELNQSGTPLDVIVPREGVITADYPLMLLAQSNKADFYNKLVTFIRSEATQQWIVTNTHRDALKGTASDNAVNELPFPGNLRVVDALLRGFMDTYSKPASSYFLLDVSGSMEGSRINDMRSSLLALVTADGSVTGRFATFREREHVYLTPFSGLVYAQEEYLLTDSVADNAKLLQKATTFVKGLHADGGTAIYDALISVYAQAQSDIKLEGRAASIVLLTDGINNTGARLRDFMNMVRTKGEPRVPVYGILYGEANSDEMQELTRATGGQVFDARKQPLKKVLKSIRAYQ